MFCVFFLLGYLSKFVFSTKGVDVCYLGTVSCFKCLKNEGYQYAIVRCYEEKGVIDPACVDSVNNAWEAGISEVDVYIFPRPKAGHGEDQVKAVVEHLRSHGVNYGRIWLDIEGSQYWMKDHTENQAFLEQMLGACGTYNSTCAIYTSASQWIPIMGSDYHQHSFPLWYAHYDNNPSFDDFKEFAGWTSPFMKQYLGDQTLCGCGKDNVDFNWRP